MSMSEPLLTANQPNGSDPSQDQAADNPDAFTCTGRLLSVVRKLIDYGKDLAATLQQRTAATNLAAITRPFGKIDIALILARITQGLHRAAALETRLIDRAQQEEAGLPRVSASPPRRPRAAPPVPRCPSDADSRIARLPTPEQIAAEVRRRPIGAVIADICREFGIMPDNPLWRELSMAIVMNGGDLNALLTDIFKRVYTATAKRTAAERTASPAPCPRSAKPSATGPPRTNL
jgi:hypothetical protein